MYSMIYYHNILYFYDEYALSLIFLNVYLYIYLLINIFLIMLLFDLKYFKTLNQLKFFNNLPTISIFIILIMLSLAGIPPLLGFISKFLMFLFIFYKKNWFLVFIFLFVNMFSIYFYLQNLRFLISKKSSSKLNIKNNFVYLNKNIIFSVNILNFFNIFFIFYFEELTIYFNYIVSFVLV